MLSICKVLLQLLCWGIDDEHGVLQWNPFEQARPFLGEQGKGFFFFGTKLVAVLSTCTQYQATGMGMIARPWMDAWMVLNILEQSKLFEIARAATCACMR